MHRLFHIVTTIITDNSVILIRKHVCGTIVKQSDLRSSTNIFVFDEQVKPATGAVSAATNVNK